MRCERKCNTRFYLFVDCACVVRVVIAVMKTSPFWHRHIIHFLMWEHVAKKEIVGSYLQTQIWVPDNSYLQTALYLHNIIFKKEHRNRQTYRDNNMKNVSSFLWDILTFPKISIVLTVLSIWYFPRILLYKK